MVKNIFLILPLVNVGVILMRKRRQSLFSMKNRFADSGSSSLLKYTPRFIKYWKSRTKTVFANLKLKKTNEIYLLFTNLIYWKTRTVTWEIEPSELAYWESRDRHNHPLIWVFCINRLPSIRNWCTPCVNLNFQRGMSVKWLALPD